MQGTVISGATVALAYWPNRSDHQALLKDAPTRLLPDRTRVSATTPHRRSDVVESRAATREIARGASRLGLQKCSVGVDNHLDSAFSAISELEARICALYSVMLTFANEFGRVFESVDPFLGTVTEALSRSRSRSFFGL